MTNNFEKIKMLRKATNAGLNDCHSALAESEGDLDKAMEILRKKLILKSDAKLQRDSTNGLVALNINNKKGTLIIISSETDFIAKNKIFCNLTANILKITADKNFSNIDEILAHQYLPEPHNIKEEINLTISKLNENIKIKEYSNLTIENPGQIVGGFVHNVVDGYNYIGKKAAIILLECDNPNEEIQAMANKIAMHIVAMQPVALSSEKIDENLIKEKKEQYTEEVKKLNKPEHVAQKIIDGMMQKYYNENTLHEQSFIMNDKMKIKEYIAEEAKKLNQSIKIINYIFHNIDE